MMTTSLFGTAFSRRAVAGIALRRSAFSSRWVGPSNSDCSALVIVSVVSRAIGRSTKRPSSS